MRRWIAGAIAVIGLVVAGLGIYQLVCGMPNASGLIVGGVLLMAAVWAKWPDEKKGPV